MSYTFNVDFSPLTRALRGRKAKDVLPSGLRTALTQLMVRHKIHGDTPGQFAFIADMLNQCPEEEEQLRILCMRIARLICIVHEHAISKCLFADYGIGPDIGAERVH